MPERSQVSDNRNSKPRLLTSHLRFPVLYAISLLMLAGAIAVLYAWRPEQLPSEAGGNTASFLSEVGELPSPSGGLTAIAFSLDGTLLASSSLASPFDAQQLSTIQLWDVAKLQATGTLYQSQGDIYTLAFSTDGQHLAAGDVRGSIYIWNLKDKNSGPQVISNTAEVRSMVFSPADGTLITGGDDGAIRFWNTVLASPQAETLTTGMLPITSLSISRDGMALATAQGQEARMWDLSKPDHPFQTFKSTGRFGVASVAIGSEAQILAMANDDGTIDVWTFGSGDPSQTTLHTSSSEELDYNARIMTLALSSDDRYLVTSHADKRLRFWDLTHPSEPPAVSGTQPSPADALAYQPGSNLLGAATNRAVRLWRVQK